MNASEQPKKIEHQGNGSPPAAQPWMYVIGAVFLGLAFLFFGALVFVALFTAVDLCAAKFPMLVVLGLAAAIGFVFLGGAAAVEGRLPLPAITEHPLVFGLSGGTAALLIVLSVGSYLFPCPSSLPTKPYLNLSDLEVLREEVVSVKVVARFDAQSLSRGQRLVLEIASDPDFTAASILKSEDIPQWTAKQAITSFAAQDLRAIWARLRVLDNGVVIASSRTIERKVPRS